MWGKPVIPRRSLNFHLSPLGRLCGGVWYLRKDSCGLLSALEFPMVALELPLIGLMDFQGRQSGALLIWCQDWTLCGLLGDQPGQVGVRGWFRKQLLPNLFRQGGLGTPLSPSPTCSPGLVGSCRRVSERRVLPFKPPSRISQSFKGNCLFAAPGCLMSRVVVWTFLM